MSSYDFDVSDAQNMVLDLIEQGWTPPTKDGNRRDSDTILMHAQTLVPLFQKYIKK